jgi:hypothetical protein
MAMSGKNGNGKHPETINEDGTTARMPARLQRHSIKGLREGYAEVYDAVMNGSLHHQSAAEANKALGGSLNTFKTELHAMQQAKFGEDKLRQFTMSLLGIEPDEAKKLEKTTEAKDSTEG